MAETPQDIGWLVWNFDRAKGKDAWLVGSIPEAIAAFEADHDTGQRAVQWLQTESAKASSDSITWLYYDVKSKRIEAFFAIRKTDQLEETSRLSSDQPLEIATEIVWLCKHSQAELHGKKIMAMVLRRATELWSDYPVGTIVTLLLNPQGADATKLLEKYDFWLKVRNRDLFVAQVKLRDDLPPQIMQITDE